jgi:hypothetical protein
MGATKSMENQDRWFALAIATALGLLPGLAGASWSDAQQLAYVDPGAGSFILQALVAAMAGIVVALNVYWRKIKGFLGFGKNSTDAENPTHLDSADD